MTTRPATAALFFFRVSHITRIWDSGFCSASPVVCTCCFLPMTSYTSFFSNLIRGSRKRIDHIHDEIHQYEYHCNVAGRHPVPQGNLNSIDALVLYNCQCPAMRTQDSAVSTAPPRREHELQTDNGSDRTKTSRCLKCVFLLSRFPH